MKRSTSIQGRLFLVSVLVLTLTGIGGVFAQNKSEVEKVALPVLEQKLRSRLLTYLKEHYQTPEDYIVGKFKDHQIV